MAVDDMTLGHALGKYVVCSKVVFPFRIEDAVFTKKSLLWFNNMLNFLVLCSVLA